jgi:type II secretory pathway component PulF
LLFSEALQKEKAYFEPLFPFFCKLGERGGSLNDSLRAYVNYLNRMISLKDQLFKLLFTPMLICLAGVGSLIFLSYFLFPNLSSLFADNGLTPPYYLVLILKVKELLAGKVIVLILFVSAGTCFFVQKGFLQKISLKIMNRDNFLARFYLKFLLWHFFQNLAVLIQTGVSLLDSLQVQKKIFKNAFFQEKLQRIIFRLRGGELLSSSLRKEFYLDRISIELLQTAEETGSIIEALNKVGGSIEKELNKRLQFIIKWLEPMITVTLGGLIALIFISIMAPLSNMISAL